MVKRELIRLLKAAVLCIAFCALLALGVALLLRTPLLSGLKAYLYRLLLLDALCCLLLLAVVVFVWIKTNEPFGISLSSAVLCVGLSTLLMALFLSLGPMTIERSYTIYSLAEMRDSSQEVYSAQEMKGRFIDGFIEEANENQKRIDEQVSVGNLEPVDGGYKITSKGKRLIDMMRLVEAVFPVPDKTCIYPNGN